jgi:hypothetical protein
MVEVSILARPGANMKNAQIALIVTEFTTE